ncbi:Protein-tyrosine phosphatase, receptor/non-receptor type domain and Protein-tyrosine/Dual specificity phosphatase domain and Protein-tyrosine phosphatase, catalytic domain-containing protein [Strongyloides ratti]|uniref:Protein-tyrosine phosphatase, receptor/non-receptor type domain and Protein-tyrosine/Dual specificity phosphatase domain and Protein-tyrosine phosphatase, catalytic domain-containing protein n=1 Tax=Strongyloides ratti TaxID=34506 RepID=A0A090L743_STRRB|nr:Protein-tyrosine phosphatase, receptor/non-receptor type domain and Protein-tyrosine/Dual specificity phosphatase domain and Protein-tyrosine phosphatase, catalytic domain-containing protein [Strongyloides ratti]CEF65601.1 Protein-tyrosine phosphatase, receptor/non-receptor type domain and Protein-tyrosine/Dual specificity phosphatase domain and Protein-tyrosine phosphatase, catalytic domain-containing protein [Strongyloides ratti]
MIRNNKRKAALRKRGARKTRNRTEDTCNNGGTVDDYDIEKTNDKKGSVTDFQTQDQGAPELPPKEKSTQVVGIKTERTVLKEFIANVSKYTIQQIFKEYSELKSTVFAEHTKTAFDSNMNKNRYKDIVCCDQTRVVLNGEIDYIHANYVGNKLITEKIICCQAPMDSTVNEFWKMIVQDKVVVITKLCQIMENNKPRCFQYWPIQVGQLLQFGNVTVKHLNTEQSDPSYALIKLQVIDEQNKINMAVEIINWNDWPDRLVPKNSTAILKLLRRLQTYKGTMIIHCSAGIGRTGTVAALHIIMSKILNKQSFLVYDLVKILRSQRPQSVQTDIQYLFIFKVIADYCVSKNIRTPELNKFILDYEAHFKTLNMPPE